jgi:hypothetical protein
VRARLERVLYPPGLDNTGYFNDFAAINAGSGFDVRGIDLSGDRYLNVDQDRTRPRLRARLGVDADVAPWVGAGIRLATGENGAPVSTNQTLGANGGDFSKYPVWLDRAFIRVGTPPDASRSLALAVGRFENPFFKTELLWSESVNMDGAALTAASGSGFKVFGTAGAFPTFSTPLAYAAERPAKYPSHDKWLLAGQVGTDWRPTPQLGIKLGVAYYDFYGVEGRASSPCDTNLKGITCDTDDTRPPFAQKGNTYRALRTPSSQALVAEATGASRYQYFGLASSFREVAGTLRIELPAAGPVRPALDGEYVWNAAFSKSRAAEMAVNNFAQCTSSGCQQYGGGAHGVLASLTLASANPEALWTWEASLGFRRIETDAVVDAFNDPDFGLGGTNLRGYVAGFTLGYTRRVNLTVRWFSADRITGAPYGVDVLQTELLARF